MVCPNRFRSQQNRQTNLRCESNRYGERQWHEANGWASMHSQTCIDLQIEFSERTLCNMQSDYCGNVQWHRRYSILPVSTACKRINFPTWTDVDLFYCAIQIHSKIIYCVGGGFNFEWCFVCALMIVHCVLECAACAMARAGIVLQFVAAQLVWHECNQANEIS